VSIEETLAVQVMVCAELPDSEFLLKALMPGIDEDTAKRVLTILNGGVDDKLSYWAEVVLGNVWEWVGDWYDRYYYKDAPLKNPMGPRYGNERVCRGCGFNSAEGVCRLSLRNYNKPSGRTIYLGFRLVLQ